ncbi:MAG: iron-containing alcohol dehydrogenase [Clostridia bacterium]|nr:iron-containing alcohol dehydrogenase [Clostridia bacterium]
MKSFDIKTKIYFGESSLDRLEQLDSSKILIVADPFVVKSGLGNQITSRLDRASIDYEVFSDVIPDPTIEKITLGVSFLVKSKADTIIAVGGGSAIDQAKAMREVVSQMDEYKGVHLRLVAIPTTSGTGSEVTAFSVISDTESGQKFPLVADSILPDEAILDVELVKTVPPAITADTGMDVLTHAIEAYVSKNNDEFSAALAEKSVEIIGSFLLRSYLDNNDTHARSKMMCASCLAGIAFNHANLGLNHGMAHQLGAKFHIPHGRANAMLLPLIIQYNSDINKHSRSKKEYPNHVRKYVTLARLLGLQNFNTITTIRALVSWVEFMVKEMDMPLNVSSMNVCSQEEYFAAIPEMAEAALADSCTATNPRTPTKEDVMKIYIDLW